MKWVEEGLRTRFCYNCKRKLNFPEFYNLNHSIVTESQAISLWEHPIIEFYCCTCYHRQCDIHYAERKVILIGLQNTGKTAITRVLRNRCLDNILNLPPTRGKEINQFLISGTRYYVWDLGGVEAYRDRIVQQKDLIFPECTELIYFIDIQDIQLYDTSLKYLSRIINILQKDLLAEESRDGMKIYILLHKADPGLLKSSKLLNKIKNLKKEIKTILNPFKHTCKETSIFQFHKECADNLLEHPCSSDFGSMVLDLFSTIEI